MKPSMVGTSSPTRPSIVLYWLSSRVHAGAYLFCILRSNPPACIQADALGSNHGVADVGALKEVESDDDPEERRTVPNTLALGVSCVKPHLLVQR
jgi:hypothetical protein